MKKLHYKLLFSLIVTVLTIDCFGNNLNFTLATNNNIDAIEQYLQEGNDINKEDKYGNTILIYAARKGNIKMMRYLINHGAKINHINNSSTFALYELLTKGYYKNDPKEVLEMVKWMIEEKGADYTIPGHNNYTLIHVSKGLELTKYLVSLGMDIKALTKNNATTLMGSMASHLKGREEDASVQEYLINHCVDLKQKSNFSKKQDALDFAKEFGRDKAYALIKAALENPPEQCKNGGILAPKLSFYNLLETFDSENANISVQIEGKGFGVGDIILKINGTRIATNEDKTLKVKRAGLKVKTFNVKLQNGFNEITAYAYDKSNKVKSEEIVKNIVAEYKVDSKPKLYAVCIGIDEFANKSFNLKYAEADASLFGTTLFKRARALFSKVNIDYMKKKDGTTKKAILSKLEDLKDISANDFFVFYSATHGVSIDDKYYMITSNVSALDHNHIKQNAISEDELREAFSKIPTANKLLLFDTCYSGSINEKISKKLAQSSTTKLNLTSMTAANSAQTALEGFADGHGIFTFVLSDALDGEADINNDGIVQSMELVNYANKMVPIEAKKYDHKQTPAYFQSGQIFNISKLRNYKGPVDMQPQYFQQDEVKKLVQYMEKNDVKALNKAIQDKKVETKKVIEKIKKEALEKEAANAAKTLALADKKFTFGKHNFIFNDNSVFLDIKDKVKKHFNFTDSEGRHLVVFDFYSDEPAPRVVKELATEKVSDIYMADRGDWYRVTLQTKSKQGYDQVINDKGVYIKLKNQ